MAPRRKHLVLVAAAVAASGVLLGASLDAAHTAVAPPTYAPLRLSPSCGAPSTGYAVRVTGSGMTVGPSDVTIGPSSQVIAHVNVAADGSLDATITVPAQAGAGLYAVKVTPTPRVEPVSSIVAVAAASASTGIGYFSIPCPTITVQPTCGPAADGSGARYLITVAGDAWVFVKPPGEGAALTAVPVHIQLDGVEVPGSPAPPNSDGVFSVVITPGRVAPGEHTIRAYQSESDVPGSINDATLREAITTFTVPCVAPPPPPTTTPTTVPTTAPTTAPSTVTITTPTTAPTTAPPTQTAATATTPATVATLALSPGCLAANPTNTARVQVSGTGFAPGALEVLVDGRVATNAAADAGGAFSAEIDLAPGESDHAVEARQGPQRADSLLRVPCAAHPTLTLDPAVGPPGFVTSVEGSGFPPNTLVRLDWHPGIGSATVQTDNSGSFESSMLVFPLDRVGPRALRASPVYSGSFTGVEAPFLCVPGSVQHPEDLDFRR